MNAKFITLIKRVDCYYGCGKRVAYCVLNSCDVGQRFAARIKCSLLYGNLISCACPRLRVCMTDRKESKRLFVSPNCTIVLTTCPASYIQCFNKSSVVIGNTFSAKIVLRLIPVTSISVLTSSLCMYVRNSVGDVILCCFRMRLFTFIYTDG